MLDWLPDRTDHGMPVAGPGPLPRGSVGYYERAGFQPLKVVEGTTTPHPSCSSVPFLQQFPSHGPVANVLDVAALD
jgi:hypothetical protein